MFVCGVTVRSCVMTLVRCVRCACGGYSSVSVVCRGDKSSVFSERWGSSQAAVYLKSLQGCAS